MLVADRPELSADLAGAGSMGSEARTRLRYLLALFAKEVALRAHGVPGSEEALESLVEILAHAERNLSAV